MLAAHTKSLLCHIAAHLCDEGHAGLARGHRKEHAQQSAQPDHERVPTGRINAQQVHYEHANAILWRRVRHYAADLPHQVLNVCISHCLGIIKVHQVACMLFKESDHKYTSPLKSNITVLPEEGIMALLQEGNARALDVGQS